MDKARADFERGGGEHMAPDDMLRMAVSLVSSEPVRAESLYWTLVLTDSTHWTSKVAMTELGKMSFRAKDYPTTIQRMQRRIGLDPKADEAYYYIGLSYKEMKQYPEAVEALRKAASEGGANRPERHFWLGILLQQTKADAEAQQEFQKAVDLDSTCTANKALALRQLGFFKLAAKEAAAAVPLLEQSASCNEKDYQTWVWLGQARQNSGNRNNAIAAYKKALELKPGQPEASNGLKQLQAAP